MGRSPRLLLAPALAAFLFASGPARADMFSPSFIANDGERAVCHILNVSRKVQSVVIEIRYNNGDSAVASTPLAIPPGEIRLLSVDGTNSSRFHCAFLGKVTPRKARAAGEVVTIAADETKLVVQAQ